MSTKKSGNEVSGINWPKTQEHKAAEQAEQQQTLAAVAKVGQLMQAASAVTPVRQRKLLQDAVNAVQASDKALPHSGRKKNGGKRSWQRHAEQYFAENQAWKEVEDIRQGCVATLRTAMAISPMLKCRELTKLVDNPRLLNRNVQAITRDTMELVKVLGKVHALHKDKPVAAKDELELAESCTVFSQYVDFMERYDSALLPIVVHASEQLQEAMIKLKVQNPELALEVAREYQAVIAAIEKTTEFIHGNTGADKVVTPGTQVEAAAPIQEAA